MEALIEKVLSISVPPSGIPQKLSKIKTIQAQRKVIPDLDLSQLIPPPHSASIKTTKSPSPSKGQPIVAQKKEAPRSAARSVPLPQEKGQLIQEAPKFQTEEVHHQPNIIPAEIVVETTVTIATEKPKLSQPSKDSRPIVKPLTEAPQVKKASAEEVEARYKERQQKLASLLNKEKTSI